MSESGTPSSTEPSTSGQFRSLAFWMLTTLVAGVLLAVLFGSATPRIRLLGLFPLAIGALVAYGGVGLLEKFELKIGKLPFGWMILLAVGVVAGSTVCSWQIWKKHLTREHAVALARMSMILRDVDPGEQDLIRRENLRKFRETVSFPSYLSDRLDAFSKRLGQNNVWDSPVPELIFGLELFLALVGAWVVVLQGTRQIPED